jgi:hypothetical protein
VCRIYIRSSSSSSSNDSSSGNCYGDSTTGEQLEGVLTLVDLAGSEMRIDSDKHDAGEATVYYYSSTTLAVFSAGTSMCTLRCCDRSR